MADSKSITPSRRTFTKLSLLTSAVFSLAPRNLLAKRPVTLESLWGVRRKNTVLQVSMGVRNDGSELVEVITAFGGILQGRYGGSRRVQIQARLLTNAAPHPLSFSGQEYTDLNPPSDKERASRAPRQRWLAIAPGAEAQLAEMNIPWPDGIAWEGARLSIDAFVPTRESYARLHADALPITAQKS